MERLLESYDTAYGMKFVALRYFNAAGATEKCGEDHQPESHLIPNVLSAALGQQQAIRVFGNNYPTPDGTPIRDYIHVVDLADAHIRALEYLRSGGQSDFLNLGTGKRLFGSAKSSNARAKSRDATFPSRSNPRAPGDPATIDCRSFQGESCAGLGACRVRFAFDRSLRVGMAAPPSERLPRRKTCLSC